MLKKILGKNCNREYVSLVGNATTAIYVALVALGLKNKRVAVSNSVCFNVPLAIRLSGNQPFYIDVSLETLGIDVDNLSENIKFVDAVLAVHAYGAICDIGEIGALCEHENIPLIEDFAVAQGGVANKNAVGSFGDVSIVSFGTGKIIDVGHGGALLTNDKELYAEFNGIIKQLKKYERGLANRSSKVSMLYTDLYNSYFITGNKNKLSSMFSERAGDYLDDVLYQFNYEYEEAITKKIKSIDKSIECRIENYIWLTQYFKEHEGFKLKTYSFPKGSVPWRFNLFLESRRDMILKKLLAENYLISSWFPPVSIFFDKVNIHEKYTPVSEMVGKNILNLWVNEEIDMVYLKNISRKIVECLDDTNGVKKA